MGNRSLIAAWGMRGTCALLTAQITVVVCEADPATIGGEGLAQCAAIAANDRRLACYDALAGRLGLTPAHAPSPVAGTAAPPAAATTASPVATPTAPVDEKLFGLNKPVEPVARGPDSLKANVADLAADSLGNVSVLLDNGQTWTFNDAYALLRKGDAVVIKRAALGSFMMTTPSKRTYRVRRIK
jgi:hypothetical protein